MRRLPFTARDMALVVVLGALQATPALAQQEPEEQERGRRCICVEAPMVWTHELPEHQVLSFSRRAMLGVTLDPTDDAPGLRVEGITDGGPADRAGLQSGDVLVRIDDLDLAAMEDDDAYDAVVDYLGDEVEPGDTVDVAFERDGEVRRANVVTESWGLGGFAFSGPGAVVRVRPDVDRIRGMLEHSRPVAPMPPRVAVAPEPRALIEHMVSGLRFGLDLVDMSPGLETYFDTDRGVLVVRADEDSDTGLRAGDVILSIDGREVRDARHARRILDSYRSDEAIEFEIMRDGRRTTVTGEVP